MTGLASVGATRRRGFKIQLSSGGIQPTSMAKGSTQTQTQATQGRRAREPSADESESDREFDAAAQTQGGNGGLREDVSFPACFPESKLTTKDIASKAADLVRLMLFMEYKRRPVQRPMITQQGESSSPAGSRYGPLCLGDCN